MSKIPTDLVRHALNGPTMGTRWSALFHAPIGTDPAPINAALADAVNIVDCQMSTWMPDSDLMRVNWAPVGTWVSARPELMAVLAKGLEVGRLSNGAFDIGMGDVVTAWGFGPQEADPQAIRAALGKARPPAYESLEHDPDALKIRKLAPLALDLSGIAKGYAVDQMMAVLRGFGIADCLVGLDGEMRACGARPDGRPLTVAVERPDYDARAPLSIIELNDGAVATSGDYRHWVKVGDQRLSHIMNPTRGGPLTDAPASVTVLADTCMEADAWATALMVAGQEKGTALALKHALTAIFIYRDGSELRQTQIGGA
ncbi:FAD:protein FMN transferase [Aliiroseovarius sediminis]|uniref:FAD:protein FMN transferase n=1 Tax=Aliiroseovarius sediminis TaxID=2925839 RepID=UPI001F5696FA|nr:FAD:protein FMN transferase [Aliiroseovarius sediminis]MCI2395718.1 FAD:protein FMN transferase [Aliiroseovarius sediminis]